METASHVAETDTNVATEPSSKVPHEQPAPSQQLCPGYYRALAAPDTPHACLTPSFSFSISTFFSATFLPVCRCLALNTSLRGERGRAQPRASGRSPARASQTQLPPPTRGRAGCSARRGQLAPRKPRGGQRGRARAAPGGPRPGGRGQEGLPGPVPGAAGRGGGRSPEGALADLGQLLVLGHLVAEGALHHVVLLGHAAAATAARPGPPRGRLLAQSRRAAARASPGASGSAGHAPLLPGRRRAARWELWFWKSREKRADREAVTRARIGRGSAPAPPRAACVIGPRAR